MGAHWPQILPIGHTVHVYRANTLLNGKLGWDGTYSVIGVYAVMWPLLCPIHSHFFMLQSCLGRNSVRESSEFGSEGGLWILQGIRRPVPEICDWWWETDQRRITRTDWTDYYSSRLSSTNSLLQCSGTSSACNCMLWRSFCSKTREMYEYLTSPRQREVSLRNLYYLVHPSLDKSWTEAPFAQEHISG